MKHYINPEIALIMLACEDVLTTSDNYESDIFFDNSKLIEKN